VIHADGVVHITSPNKVKVDDDVYRSCELVPEYDRIKRIEKMRRKVVNSQE